MSRLDFSRLLRRCRFALETFWVHGVVDEAICDALRATAQARKDGHQEAVHADPGHVAAQRRAVAKAALWPRGAGSGAPAPAAGAGSGVPASAAGAEGADSSFPGVATRGSRGRSMHQEVRRHLGGK